MLPLLLLWFVATLAHGESAPPCTEVHAHVSVLTRHDQVVSGLAASNFVAELNGKPAQVESSVRDPLRHRLVILVDHSGSMGGLRWHIAREATLALLNRLPTQIPVQVISFDTDILRLVSFDTARPQAIQTVTQFFSGVVPKSRTRLYDAIHAALATLQPVRPGDLLYLISDGSDNVSNENGDQMQKELLQSRIRMFLNLLIPSDEQYRNDDEALWARNLTHMAEQTGGLYQTVVARESTEMDVGQREKEALLKSTLWMMQNMIEDYELTLISPLPLPSKAKLKLRVIPPQATDEKFKVIAPPSIVTTCP